MGRMKLRHPGARQYRFVGGPWHGTKHYVSRGTPSLEAVIPQGRELVWRPDTPIEQWAWETARYELRRYEGSPPIYLFIHACLPKSHPLIDQAIQCVQRGREDSYVNRRPRSFRRWKKANHRYARFVRLCSKRGPDYLSTHLRQCAAMINTLAMHEP